MNLKRICLLLSIMFIFSIVFFNVAEAKTEIAKVEFDYYTFELDSPDEFRSNSDGTYFFAVAKGQKIPLIERPSTSGIFELTEGDWNTESNKNLILYEPQKVKNVNTVMYYLTLQNDGTALFRTSNNEIASGTWSDLGFNKKIELKLFITIYDDHSAFTERPFHSAEPFEGVNRINNNVFGLLDANNDMYILKLFDNGNAELSTQGQIFSGGKWSGTINTPTPTTQAITTSTPTPTTQAITTSTPPQSTPLPYSNQPVKSSQVSVSDDVLILLLIIFLFVVGYFYKKSRKNRTSKTEPRSSSSKANMELDRLTEQKDKVSSLLLKLDERFNNNEISEPNYEELKEKYENQLKDLEKQIIEIELND